MREAKDVVLNDIKYGEKFYNLLERICKDFNIKNSKEVIRNYCKKHKIL